MDSKSKAILTAAAQEKLELVQMLYSQGMPDLGMAEYSELRRLGHQLREITDGNTRPNSSGTDPDSPTE